MEDNRPVRLLNVRGCARCGNDHDVIEYRQFVNPIEDDDGTLWKWWGMCPVTHDPILMRDIEPKATEADSAERGA